MFWGYSLVHKGYLCLHPFGKVYISHDVINELELPYSEYGPKYGVFLYLISLQDSSSLSITFCLSDATIVRDMIRLSVVSFPIAFDIPFGLPPAIDHFLELTQTPLSNIHTSPTLPHEFTTSSHPSKSLLAHAPIPCHLMITRAKSGIVKLKVCSTLVHPLSISPSPIEPMCIKQALVDPNWKILMEEEYKALMRNHIWELVPYQSQYNVVSNK